MFLAIVLSVLALHLAISAAAPAESKRASSVIASQCTDTQIRNNWYIGNCLTGADATTRIQSAVYLGNKITNSDGDLQWQTDGSYFQSCSSCNIISSGTTLNCSCTTTWQSKKPATVAGTIDLEEHISVYNGHLLSNLTSTPQPPNTTSAYPIPSDFTWSIGGTTNCTDVQNPTDVVTPDKCPFYSPCSNTSAHGWQDVKPLTCYVPVIYFPQYHYAFQSLKLEGQGAWEVTGYADESCQGSVVGTAGPAQEGQCVDFGGARAITVKPAFNGDPN